MGLSPKKGPMIPCKACSVRKEGWLGINKHVYEIKKVTRAGKRIFSVLATIKEPQDSGITITNRNWQIVVDQYTAYKESQFYSTKSDFVEPMCKKFSKWKNNRKPISYNRLNNAPENKVLMKITNDLQWKLGIITKYTSKGMPQRNQLSKLGFADVTGKERAIMVVANLPKEIKYKLCKECFNCAKYFSNLAVMTINGQTATRYKHFHEAKPHCAKHFRIWGEAGTVSMGKNRKVGKRGTHMIFISYAKNHAKTVIICTILILGM